MPRPQKAGIDYFPLDVNFFADKKVKILKARYGADGVAIYLYLLCEIYRAGYYIKFDDDALFITSDDLGMSPDKVKQVLKFLLERSLFNDTLFQSDTILTSAGIQKRFQLAVKERAKKNPIEIKGFWLLDEAETESFIKVNQSLNFSRKNDSNSRKNPDKSQEESLKESKVKKSKEKESKGNISCTQPDKPSDALQVISLTLNDKTEYPVYDKDFAEWVELYPAVDIMQELRKMKGWLDSNPTRRKTVKGIRRFINNWLSKAQDSPHVQKSQTSQERIQNRVSDVDNW